MYRIKFLMNMGGRVRAVTQFGPLSIVDKGGYERKETPVVNVFCALCGSYNGHFFLVIVYCLR
jgi:hypothetical protein